MSLDPDLFPSAPAFPEGFRYTPELISPAEELALIGALQHLPFKAFEFHGFTGKRRVISFGWRYDFNGGGLTQAEPIPDFLLPVQSQAAKFAGIAASDIEHVLLTEYGEGASIGWHRDRSVFGDVIGISLLSPCTFRLRKKEGSGWQRASLELESRSAYLLSGTARTAWEHSIPGVDRLRYSITFRTLRGESTRLRQRGG